MRGRPKIEDSRTNQYRIRLNDEENEKLNYASKATGKAKSEIFRIALLEYYNNVLLNEINIAENVILGSYPNGNSVKCYHLQFRDK